MADDVSDSSVDFYSNSPRSNEVDTRKQKRKRHHENVLQTKRSRLYDDQMPKFSSVSESSKLHAPVPFTPVRAKFTTDEKIKSERRDSIEQKCAELYPPVPPSLLVHMEAYQTAIQIAKPLSDIDWAQLQPKLLDQLDYAKAKQSKCMEARSKAEHDDLDTERSRRYGFQNSPNVNVSPIRRLLFEVAQGILLTHPTSDLDRDTVPLFAATVLMQIRNQIEAELLHKHPGLSKPTLSDMKWLYDSMLSPITSPFRKDIFQCAGCSSKSRPYSFEGLIQHYGAKHTQMFSAGSSVVSWQQSEWPLSPPFMLMANGGPSYLYSQPWPRSTGYRSNNASLLSSPISFSYTPGTSPHALSIGTAFSGYGPWQPPAFSPTPSAIPRRPSHSLPNSSPTSPLDPNAPFYVPPNVNATAASTYSNAPFYIGSVTQAPSNLYQAQLAEVADIAYTSWKDLDNLKGIHPAIRVVTILCQVVARFKARHYNRPSLELFADALQNNTSMTPLKNINGLGCKMCNGVKLYHLQSLIAHFREWHHGPVIKSRSYVDSCSDDHEQGQATGAYRPQPQPDWTIDLIHLPPDAEILRIERALASDSILQRAMIHEAFPTLFSQNQSRYVPATVPEEWNRQGPGFSPRFLRDADRQSSDPQYLKILPPDRYGRSSSLLTNSQEHHVLAADMTPIYVSEPTAEC